MLGVAKGSALKGSCPLNGSTEGRAAAAAGAGGRELAEELLETRVEVLVPEKGSPLLNMSSPVAGAEEVTAADWRGEGA